MALDFVVTSQGEQKAVGYTIKEGYRTYINKDLIYPQTRPSGPTNYAFTESIAKDWIVLSRIAPRRKDAPPRSANFIAHHLVLNKQEVERCKAGPAFLLKRRSFVEEWDKGEKEYPPTEILATDYLSIGPEEYRSLLPADFEWEYCLDEMTRVADDERRRFILIYDWPKRCEETILNLFYVGISRLKPAQRWAIPFAVYASDKQKAIPWRWLGVDKNDKDAVAWYRGLAERSNGMYTVVDC